MKHLLISALLLVFAQAAEVHAQRLVKIDNAALIATEDARHRLKYLASCALDEATTLAGTVDGKAYEFPGGMGLASNWGNKPLTLAERRWVSACVLARTNAFGAHVLISMRADQGDIPSLMATPEELESHGLFEAGFFGDIFAEEPVAFVCVGADHLANTERRATLKRVCTHPSKEISGRTECGFISIGVCPEGKPPMVKGELWPEVIKVWLAGESQPPEPQQ